VRASHPAVPGRERVGVCSLTHFYFSLNIRVMASDFQALRRSAKHPAEVWRMPVRRTPPFPPLEDGANSS
jgi:hypothetical protein